MERLAPGARLGADLTLERLLGAGGLGQAWLCRDRAGRAVVAKVAPPGAPEERARLLEREWHLTKTLDHPAIVRVLGLGREGGRVWLRLEHVPGGDAGQLRGRPPREVLQALLPVVDALEHAHAWGIVHRDLKASNVLLDLDGRGRLADFGHSEPLPGGPPAPSILGGGSPDAMSPQQRAGEAAHPADDVYAFGALLEDLLEGRRPELTGPLMAPSREDRPDLTAVRVALLGTLQELEAGGVARGSETAPRKAVSRREVALVPPPRVEDVIRPAPLSFGAGTPARGSTHRLHRVTSAALLPALAAAALAVFVYLPRWVARSAHAPATGAATAAQSGALAAPAPAGTEPSSGDDSRSSRPAPVGSTPPTEETATMPPATNAAPSGGDEDLAGEEAPSGGEGPADGRAAAFARAVSEGLAALDRGEPAEARAAFTRAEAARPGTQAVADGLARAEEGIRAAALRAHRQRGEAAEAAEQWRAALAEYDAALKVEPAVAFALEGRARSVGRADLDERLEDYLRRPDRLSSEAVAREAEKALDRARDAEPAGPRLGRQIAAVERALEAARTPVDVRLLSDGLTHVVVLRVGPVGAFRERALPLRPGSYVVVGTRRGYRDVRRTLQVTPGRSPDPLIVKCDEAL